MARSEEHQKIMDDCISAFEAGDPVYESLLDEAAVKLLQQDWDAMLFEIDKRGRFFEQRVEQSSSSDPIQKLPSVVARLRSQSKLFQEDHDGTHGTNDCR